MLVFNEQSNILARRLDECAEQPDKTHDLYPYISACTLDIITGLTISIYFLLQNKNDCFLEAATGTHPNAQSGDGKNEFVEATIR
jgi:hypothetical protein